jgi:hypothetical protein
MLKDVSLEVSAPFHILNLKDCGATQNVVPVLNLDFRLYQMILLQLQHVENAGNTAYKAANSRLPNLSLEKYFATIKIAQEKTDHHAKRRNCNLNIICLQSEKK